VILDRWESSLYLHGEPTRVSVSEYRRLLNDEEVMREDGTVLTIEDGPFLFVPDEEFIERGGPGSGHHGHAGRPGEVGGSEPGEGGGGIRGEGKSYRGGTFTPLSGLELESFARMVDPNNKMDPATSIGWESPRGKFPMRDPETGEVGWLEGGRDPVLAHIENQYKNFSLEVGTAILEDGTLITRAIGSPDGISFETDDIEAMMSAADRGETLIFTHNHPGVEQFPDAVYTLSGRDVESTLKMGFSEVRATTPNGTYYMKILDREAASDISDVILGVYGIALEGNIRLAGYDPDSAEMTEVKFMSPDHANAYSQSADLAWQEVSEIFADVLEYGLEKKK